jgi:hypothetical protein
MEAVKGNERKMDQDFDDNSHIGRAGNRAKAHQCTAAKKSGRRLRYDRLSRNR